MSDWSHTLYQAVKSLAARHLHGDAAERSICVTDLANEAIERALRQHTDEGLTRGRFLGYVSHLVRQVLVDHARRRGRLRHGGAVHIVQLAADPTATPDMLPVDVLSVNDALQRLESLDPRQSKMIEMRYFGGLSVPEVAVALDVSESTVEKEVRKAKAFLALELADEADPEPVRERSRTPS